MKEEPADSILGEHAVERLFEHAADAYAGGNVDGAGAGAGPGPAPAHEIAKDGNITEQCTPAGLARLEDRIRHELRLLGILNNVREMCWCERVHVWIFVYCFDFFVLFIDGYSLPHAMPYYFASPPEFGLG